eukprot:308946-Pelagomonas_calceolata.AAC.5
MEVNVCCARCYSQSGCARSYEDKHVHGPCSQNTRIKDARLQTVSLILACLAISTTGVQGASNMILLRFCMCALIVKKTNRNERGQSIPLKLGAATFSALFPK